MEKACGDNRELRRRVESYLAEETGAQNFMETPAFSLNTDGGNVWQFEETGVGDRIGSYEVKRLLGRGGMGTVYLAVRVDEFEKRVALKVLRPGMNTEEIARRFRHERQILAHLDHPNIAKLLDGGTTEKGVPYFVMEYVEGEPLDRYCQRQGLGIRARLELFRKVCSAVHRAHQNLVVHRDLKPANILVGGDGEPKLLDFGIAKPLDVDGAATGLTASGFHPMTLAYASPEQVCGQVITTASDVYSLGVVLYELLTGSHPTRKPGSTWLDLANAIQTGPPQKPSTADDLAPLERRADDGETQTPGALRRERGEDVRDLRRRLTGDLDSIVLTALSKQPERRYASVEQLSADIGRHLEGLPVTARKLTLAYWVGKFVRRHKIEAAMAAIVLVAILSFSIVAFQLRNEAVRERERAEEVSDFLVELFRATGPDAPEITARELLDRGKRQFMEYRGSQPQLYAQLASTMGEVYYSLGLYRDAQALFEDALVHYREHVGGKADPQLAILINDLAAALMAQEQLAAAETLFREALKMKISLYGEDAVENLLTLNNLATLVRQRDLDAAEKLYRKSLRIRQTLNPPVPLEVAKSHSHLGLLLLDKGDYQGAEAHLNEALAIRREILGSQNTKVAVVLLNLGISLQAQGRAAESEEIYRQALEIRRARFGERHHKVAAVATNLASLLVATGRFEEAKRLALEALETFREAMPDTWRIAHAQSVLGSCLAGAGRFEEAEPLLLESYPILVEHQRECTRYTTDAVRRLIDLYDGWERQDESEKYRAQLKECTTPG